MTMVLSTESLLLPIEKQSQTQPIVKKGVNKKFSRLYLGIWKKTWNRKFAGFQSKTQIYYPWGPHTGNIFLRTNPSS